jgi:hypothetical protein
MNYGDKRAYAKIDLYVEGNYLCSTTWARTCKEAIERLIRKLPQYSGRKVIARFSND